MRSFLSTLVKFNDFDGRATRSEFWVFMAGYALFQVVAGITAWYVGRSAPQVLLGAGVTVYALMLVPFFSVMVRRLHDAGRSGAWILAMFVPVGAPFLLLWFLWPSNPGWNEYGPQPSNGSNGENIEG